MEIQLIIQNSNKPEAAGHLRTFLLRESIDGLKAIDIERDTHTDGQMGAGAVLNSIKAVINAAEKPLVELVKCLQKYVENYRTTVTIPTKNGNIEISHGRSMSPKDLKELVTAIQEKITP